MSYFGKKWRNNPIWSDFASLVLLWGYLFIPAIFIFGLRQIWWALLLAVAGYSIVIYLTYKHVKQHKDKQEVKLANQNAALQ